jgi:hypothetical protein
LARLAFVIPAVPDRFELVRFVMVLLPASIVLFVKVSVLVLPTKVSLTVGNAKLVPSVPVKVKEFDAVKVFPAAIDKVLPPLFVTVNPFTVVNDGVVVVAKVIVPTPLLVVVMFVPAASVNVPPWEIVELPPLVAAVVNKLPALTKQVGQEIVKVPPRARLPPPLTGPVVLIVTDGFARAAFIIEPEGKLTVPEEIVNPFDPVKSPAEVTVPVPVVDILPVVVKFPPVVIDQEVPPVRPSVTPEVPVPMVILCNPVGCVPIRMLSVNPAPSTLWPILIVLLTVSSPILIPLVPALMVVEDVELRLPSVTSLNAFPSPTRTCPAAALWPIRIFPPAPDSMVRPVDAGVVISGDCPPARVTTPAGERLKFDEVNVRGLAPNDNVEAAAPVKLSAPEEFTVTTPVPEPIFEVPEEVREVNVPAAGVPPPIGPGEENVAPPKVDAFPAVAAFPEIFTEYVPELTTDE